MKSLMMCLYLASVSVGNLFVAGVNHFIQIPSAATEQWEPMAEGLKGKSSQISVSLPGYDEKLATNDDFEMFLTDGRRSRLQIPAQQEFWAAADRIEESVAKDGEFPSETAGKSLLSEIEDPWGNSMIYQILNSRSARLMSAGPDKKLGTKWDLGMVLTLPEAKKEKKEGWTAALHPGKPWIERHKQKIGMAEQSQDGAEEGEVPLLSREVLSGGQTKLMGAAYFWFFTAVMFLTAIAFIPYAMLYKPRTYLQD